MKELKRRFDTLKNGLRIHSLTDGSREKTPLILIHGYPTNALLWRHCIHWMSKYFKVYAPDLPGYGQSDKKMDFNYDLDFYVEFLKEYFDALKIDKANICVHDIGGQIGLGFVSKYQEKINKFVILDCLAYEEWPDNMMQFFKYVNSPFWSKILYMKPVFAYQFFRDKNIVYNYKKISKKIVGLYHSQWDKNKKIRLKILSAPAEKMTEPLLNIKKINVPTLILWAENDNAMKTDIAEKLHNDIPNSELKFIAECGHFLPEEQPKILTEYILRFLIKK